MKAFSVNKISFLSNFIIKLNKKRNVKFRKPSGPGQHKAKEEYNRLAWELSFAWSFPYKSEPTQLRI